MDTRVYEIVLDNDKELEIEVEKNKTSDGTEWEGHANTFTQIMNAIVLVDIYNQLHVIPLDKIVHMMIYNSSHDGTGL